MREFHSRFTIYHLLFVDMVIQRLRPGNLHGHVTKSLAVADFILTESAFDPHSRLPRHAHENSYFCFVLQGAYTERYGNREVVCRPSALTFRASGQTHEDLVHGADARVFVLEISPQWIDRLRADSLRLESAFEFYGGTLTRLCARLNREFHKTDSAAKLAIEGLALELLAEATRQPVNGIGAAPAWLRQAREMLTEHFSENLKLTQIAAEVGVHPVYLATAFRQKFGVTVGEFVRKLRIEHACAELKREDLPLSAIALQAGFADQSHFSKVFKSHVGITPREYRSFVRES
ncbi:MAG TPA: AraC family transcriptional regulator [Pyrinomonadaceae bacterium]|nr:AraC family transcriptional regulator [Pyrinomonadaceae bacterium]